MPRLACGSLRPHDPHDWLGRGYLSYDLETAEIYQCGGHQLPATGDRVRVIDNAGAAALYVAAIHRHIEVSDEFRLTLHRMCGLRQAVIR